MDERQQHSIYLRGKKKKNENILFVEVMFIVVARMPNESYRRRFGSLLCSCYVFMSHVHVTSLSRCLLNLHGFSCSVYFGWLVGWLAAWLVGWLVGWLQNCNSFFSVALVHAQVFVQSRQDSVMKHSISLEGVTRKMNYSTVSGVCDVTSSPRPNELTHTMNYSLASGACNEILAFIFRLVRIRGCMQLARCASSFMAFTSTETV